MSELTTRELLQPSLLDRLTDEHPDRRSDTLEERVMSFKRLRESVIRDLEWLLNTGCLEDIQDMESYPEVKRSVLNYGIPDLAGTWVGTRDAMQLERIIRQAILDFEPRILPESLKIHVAVDSDEMSAGAIRFDIEGDLWWQPLPERFYLKTSLDLETGKFRNEP
jgi:type VI secretion system protein ImpF